MSNNIDFVGKKLEELKGLLLNKPLSEQKKIIIDFFNENKEKSKHFKNFYESTKHLFEKSTLSDFFIQEFIEKTFINLEMMTHDVFPTYIPIYDILEKNKKSKKL